MFASFLFFVFIYLCIELLFFSVADRFNIIDKPNHRSSHTRITIRGGGVIFPIAFLLPLFASVYVGWMFVTLGLISIGLISFLDDIISLNNKVRLVIQSFSVALLLEGGAPYTIILLSVLFVLVIGIINAYNFMDGINGITALYSLVTVSTLFWLNRCIISLIPDIFFISLLASLLVFSFFNLRKWASCFAGDVGSVSIAYVICFLLIKLIVKTNYYNWILLLGVYGIDTVFTIICRLFRKEQIFKAHRSHFYQFLTNEIGIGHVKVSLLYAGVQLVLNICVMQSYLNKQSLLAWAALFAILIIYIIFRLRFEGWYRLFTAYN